MADALNSNAIVTLNDANTWIHGSTNETEHDGIVRDLINEASSQIETKTRRKIITQSIPETYTGNGEATYLTRYFPVVSLTSIEIEDEVDPTVSNDDEVRIDLDKGKIYLLLSVFAKGDPLNITVTYTTGFGANAAAVAADERGTLAWQACREVVKRGYKLRDRLAENIESVSYEGGTTKYLVDKAWNKETLEKIKPLIVPYAGRRY